MLQLYIVTGCDYISYVSGIGKATFLNCFFQHAEFITGVQSSGCLSQTEATNMKAGFLSFVRLIGTVYFKKNLATVVSKLGFETPNQLYNSMNKSLNDERKHREWYLSIKESDSHYERRPEATNTHSTVATLDEVMLDQAHVGKLTETRPV